MLDMQIIKYKHLKIFYLSTKIRGSNVGLTLCGAISPFPAASVMPCSSNGGDLRSYPVVARHSYAFAHEVEASWVTPFIRGGGNATMILTFRINTMKR